MLHLKTFGDLTLTDDRGETVRTPEKGLLLMAHLFTRPDFEQRRDDIAVFLWSDTQPETASNNLRKLISRLQLMEHCPLEFTPTHIRLDIAAVTIDMDIAEAGLSRMQVLERLNRQLRRDFIGSAEQFSSAASHWMLARDPSDNRILPMLGTISRDGGREARFHRQRVLQDNPSFDVERWLEIVPIK